MNEHRKALIYLASYLGIYSLLSSIIGLFIVFVMNIRIEDVNLEYRFIMYFIIIIISLTLNKILWKGMPNNV